MNETQIMDINPNADEIKNLEAQIAGIDMNKLDPSDNMKVQADVIEPVIESTKTDATVTVEEKAEEMTEDPVKTELEKVKGQTQGKTPQEKMAYKLKLEAQRAKEMGVDVDSIFGIKKEEDTFEDSPEDKPLTRKDLDELLNRINKPQVKSATEMVHEKVQNESERELTLYYLENRVNPNLTEEEKYQTAKDMVDALKLKQQTQMLANKPEAKTFSTASSVVINKNNVNTQALTVDEQTILRDAQSKGVNLTPEEIISYRK